MASSLARLQAENSNGTDAAQSRSGTRATGPRRSSSSAAGVSAALGVPELLRLLKLDVRYDRAVGEMLYYDNRGERVEVVDMLGGYGSTILGHNHPDLKEAVFESLNRDIPMHAQGSVRYCADRLREKINEIVAAERPGSDGLRYRIHFYNSGTEAVEAAIKHALLAWQTERQALSLKLEYQQSRDELPEQQRIELGAAQQWLDTLEPTLVALEGAFHGKTAGSLSATANPDYKQAYAADAVRTVHVGRDCAARDLQRLAEEHSVDVGGHRFSALVGMIIEVVQGEGGVRPLHADVVKDLRAITAQHGIPLVVDEVQTGVYRTGRFLASHGYGIEADYVTLGKSLGGGICKISALLVREEQYFPAFSILHTSTFAEDDLSSHVALTALDLFARDPEAYRARAEHFEDRIRRGVEQLQRTYPGIVVDVRGRGLLMGVEFAPQLQGRLIPIVSCLRSTGCMTYVFASYLLHRHRVRVGATLNDSNTVRLEPSALISDASIDRCLEGLEALVKKLSQRRFGAIVGHLASNPGPRNVAVVSTGAPPCALAHGSLRTVVFLSHIIDVDCLADLDPLCAAMSFADRKRLIDELGPMSSFAPFHRQIIAGANGEKVVLELRGVLAGSAFFERCLRTGDPSALLKVRAAVKQAEAEGVSHLGLGQFTSIVSANGVLAGARSLHVTTGNAYTVAMGVEALRVALTKRGARLQDLHVGVVGAAGNICSTYAQIVADEAAQMTLVHREPIEKSRKFQMAARGVVESSNIDASRVHATCDLAELKACDVVISGTNSSRRLLTSEHLKQGAVVLDIAVPSNIDPAVAKERPDVQCLLGGYAKLPQGQALTTPIVPAPRGETLACMAETLISALCNYPGNLSFGRLSKADVLRVTELGRQVGFSVGSGKTIAVM